MSSRRELDEGASSSGLNQSVRSTRIVLVNEDDDGESNFVINGERNLVIDEQRKKKVTMDDNNISWPIETHGRIWNENKRRHDYIVSFEGKYLVDAKDIMEPDEPDEDEEDEPVREYHQLPADVMKMEDMEENPFQLRRTYESIRVHGYDICRCAYCKIVKSNGRKDLVKKHTLVCPVWIIEKERIERENDERRAKGEEPVRIEPKAPEVVGRFKRVKRGETSTPEYIKRDVEERDAEDREERGKRMKERRVRKK